MSKCGIWNMECGLALLLITLPAFADSTNAYRQIGIEGHVSLDLPRPDYRPLPLDDRTEMILRIGSIAATSNGLHRYEFYYMGFEPGIYPLADYVILPDGSRPTDLTDFQLHVKAILPEDHDGQLTSYGPGPFTYIGGYRMFLGGLGLLWVGGLAAFIFSYRRRRPAAAPAFPPPEPTFAERLRPLVEAAARRGLSAGEQAQIERLLMGYWRDRLDLPDSRMADALAHLKAHAQAGELLRTIERWLHQRGGAPREEVNTALQPYRYHPAPELTGGGTS